MISVETALNILKTNIAPLDKSKICQVFEAAGQVLYEDVLSPIHMPPFQQSAMDGYAICLHDALIYNLIGEVKAGDSHEPELKKGEAIRIFTGAPVPKTANAVIMQEKVQVVDHKIRIDEPINLGLNIRPAGEQIEQGHVALKKGTKLTAAAIGFLASLGITKISVYEKPTVAILATGNELVKAGEELAYGQIYESNSVMLEIALTQLGFTEISTYKVDDDYGNTHKILAEIIANHDVILISGGISVGDYDFVGKALHELKVKELFYKVNQKPGKPLFFGKKEDKVIFALPGNPASLLSCFYIYAQTALQIMSGDSNFTLNRITAKSETIFNSKGDRSQFLKAIYSNGKVRILEGQSSSMLHTFALANALVYVPASQNEILINESVELILLPIS